MKVALSRDYALLAGFTHHLENHRLLMGAKVGQGAIDEYLIRYVEQSNLQHIIPGF